MSENKKVSFSKITLDWLEKESACVDGIKWFIAQNDNDAIVLIEKLLQEDKFDWANWAITSILSKDNNVRYAIHAAELVLYIYEKAYPGDMRPRKAIEIAKKCLSKKAVNTTCHAATDAAAASAVPHAAAHASHAAAVYATDAYAYAAASAAFHAAASATDAASAYAVKDKIIKYGLQLIKEREINS